MEPPRTAVETYAPMPAPGTTRECWFCREPVTLTEVPAGWYHWVAAGEVPDGRPHCYGGSPGNQHTPGLRTLHTPAGVPDERPLAPRYTLDREPAFPQDRGQQTRRA